MTLADELLGRSPVKTLQGRIVSHADPEIGLTADRFREWINTVDSFTVEDVCMAFDCKYSAARALMNRERDTSQIERFSTQKTKGRAMGVWRKKAEPMNPVEKANRKFFGA